MRLEGMHRDGCICVDCEKYNDDNCAECGMPLVLPRFRFELELQEIEKASYTQKEVRALRKRGVEIMNTHPTSRAEMYRSLVVLYVYERLLRTP